MSDTSTSLFDVTQQPAQPESTSLFDASKVDENIRAISAIEDRWRLPKLPDVVKLDLASAPETTPQGISDIL